MTRLEALTALKEAVEAGGEDTPDFSEMVSRPIMQCRAGEAYRGSLDAARALHEAVLPGYFVEIRLWTSMNGGALVSVGMKDPQRNPCPARAWLLAILSALIAQEQAP